MWRMRLRWVMVMVVAAAAPAALGQPSPETSHPEAVLRRARDRLLADLARLPRYTCVQTITRRYYRPPGGPRSCARLIKEHEERENKDELPLRGWDRLRLEVAIADGQNVYSWVGAARFEEDNFEELAGHGPLGSGDFGTFLASVFRRATVSFQDEKVINGRRLLEYSYDMPAARSAYMVRSGAEWVPTAYSGTFLLDPDTADVVSLAVRTVELPEKNPACQAISEIEYGRTTIHDRVVLIPRETRLTTVDRGGGETLNVTTYESCREYSSKSRMLMSAPSDTQSAVKPQPPPPVALSPGLRFESRIVTPVDSDTAAAGDPIEAVLRSPIHDKENNLLIPAGARLRGRLLLVGSGPFLHSIRIAMRWESIEAGGRDVPLRARPEGLNPIGPVYAALDADAPDRRTFIFRTDHLRFSQFDWTWTTLASGSDDRDATPSGRRSLPKPRTVELLEREFPVEASSRATFKFSIPESASNVRLEGTFSATGGDSGNVALSLFSSDEFAKFQTQEPATALYERPRTSDGTLDVVLPSEAATYYLVFSNNFPFSTPKVVKASLRLHYQL